MRAEQRAQDHRAMTDKSAAAQATPERKPAPEINGELSRVRSSLSSVGDERAVGGSGGDRVGEATCSLETIHLDVPAVAAALSQRLYAAGVRVTPGRAVGFAEALVLVAPVSRRRLYCAARAVFVSDPAQLPAFDRVFASVFDRHPNLTASESPIEAVEDGPRPAA